METLSIPLSNLSEVSLRCGSDIPESGSRVRCSHRLVRRFWSRTSNSEVTVVTRRYRNFAPFVRQTRERKAQTCAKAILRQATDDLMIACEHSNTFSLFPSLELLPDAAVSEPVLLFGRLSPTRRQEFPLFGRRPRTAQADLAGLLPGAGIAAHILRALRECRSGFATHGMPDPSVPLSARVDHGDPCVK